MNKTFISFNEIGYKRRMNTIFKNDENILVVGLDHGTSQGLLDGLEDISSKTNFYLEQNSDAILLGPKTSTIQKNKFHKDTSSSFWLRINRINAFDQFAPEMVVTSNIAEVEDAVILGADAVVAWYVRDLSCKHPFQNNEEELARLAKQCRKYGIPLVVEPVTVGNNDDEELINTSRIAYELGADILKITYPNTAKVLKTIVNSVDVPVLLAGGAAAENEDKLYDSLEEAIEIGVKGLVIGRNLWQSEDPLKAFNKLSNIVKKNERK